MRQTVARLLIKSLGVLFVLLVLGIALVFLVSSLTHGNDVSGPALLILILVFIILFVRTTDTFRRSVRALRDGINIDTKRRLDEVSDWMASLLDNKLEVKGSSEELVDAITELFAISAGQAVQPAAHVGRGDFETILLFGASDLQRRASVKNSSATDQSTQTSYEKFVVARQRAELAGVRFDRYVRLFDERSFPNRSPEIRAGYILWLEDQIRTMERSALYRLINARRAPRWKAIRSSMISDYAFIDILGDGESGFFVRGPAFAKTQKRNAQRYILSTEGGRTPIIDTFDGSSIRGLKNHLDEMRSLDESLRD